MNDWAQSLNSALAQPLLWLVRLYRLLLSPWLGSACRFNPSCSVYALHALTAHGAGLGGYLTLKRLIRCHPWCAGGHDPVPDQKKSGTLFSSLISSQKRQAHE